jgi:excisionase family DNA binding protein
MTARDTARPLAYTVAEAAGLLRVSTSRIHSMVRAGTLAGAAGLGRSERIPSRALYELVGEPLPDVDRSADAPAIADDPVKGAAPGTRRIAPARAVDRASARRAVPRPSARVAFTSMRGT